LIISDIFLVKSFLINQRFTRLGSDTFSDEQKKYPKRAHLKNNLNLSNLVHWFS